MYYTPVSMCFDNIVFLTFVEYQLNNGILLNFFNSIEYITSSYQYIMFHEFGQYLGSKSYRLLDLKHHYSKTFFQHRRLCYDLDLYSFQYIKYDIDVELWTQNIVMEVVAKYIPMEGRRNIGFENLYQTVKESIDPNASMYAYGKDSFFAGSVHSNSRPILHAFRVSENMSKGMLFDYSLFNNDIFIIIPFLFIFCSIFIIFVYLLFINKFKNLEKINFLNLLSYNAIIICFFSIILFGNMLITTKFNNLFLFNFLFNIDRLSLNFIIFIFIILIFYFIIFNDYFKNEKLNGFEFMIIVLICVFGLICLMCSFDFLSLYLSIELQTLCLYILASYKYFSNFSAEAGLKYFVLGSLSSGFLLFGISLVYGLIGSTNFLDIYLFITGIDVPNQLDTSFFFTLTKNINFNDFDFVVNLYNYRLSIFFSFIFIIFSFFFKLGIAPFHIWLPDVYQGSPSISTFFFVLVPKISFILIFIKLLWYCVSSLFFKKLYVDLISFPLLASLEQYENLLSGMIKSFTKVLDLIRYEHSSLAEQGHIMNLVERNSDIYNLSFLFLFCSMASLIIGTFSALNQTKIKRFIAFSAITHIGFIFINLISFNILSLNVILIYVIIYTIINLNFFSIFLSIRDTFTFRKLKDINDFANIYKSNKLLSYIFLLNMFSMAGIPPFSGFFMKMYVFYNLIDHSFLILFFIVILSCISAFYYIRLIKISFFDINKNNKSIKQISKPSAYVIVLTTYLNLFFFLFPNILFEYLFNLTLLLYKFNLSNIFIYII